MTRMQPRVEAAGRYAYSATLSSARPATDYTVRIIPHCDGLAVPLEANWILWQK
jgi:starch phosphorylase